MPRFGLLVVVERCQGCNGCVVGCKNWHGDEAGEPGRIKLIDTMTGTFPDVERWLFPLICMQCKYPACVAVCRFDACVADERGRIVINRDRCVGCGLCVLACPYGVRAMRTDGKASDGCDFCLDRVEEGNPPYCVATCPTGALIFGDLNDPDSEISRAIRLREVRLLLPAYKTRPRVFYTQGDKVEKLIPRAT